MCVCHKCRKLSGGIFCSNWWVPCLKCSHDKLLASFRTSTTFEGNASFHHNNFWTKVVMLALSQIEATEKQVPQHSDSFFRVHLAWPCHLSSLVQISHRCLAQRLWQWSHPGPPAKIGFMKISCSQELSVLVSTDVCFFHRYSPRTPKWETTHHLPRQRISTCFRT